MDMKSKSDQEAAVGVAAYVYGDHCPEGEVVLTLTCGDVQAAWVNLKEGFNGDYDPDNPDDVNLLRIDLYQKTDGEWEAVEGASYCTQIPVGTDESILKSGLRYALDNFRAALSGESRLSIRKVGEALSWIGTDYDFSQPLPDLFGEQEGRA